MTIYGGDEACAFRAYQPNQYVYRLVLKAFGTLTDIPVSVDKKKML